MCALQLVKPEKVTDAFEALYHDLWVKQKEVHKPEVFTATFTELLGDEIAKDIVAKVCLRHMTGTSEFVRLIHVRQFIGKRERGKDLIG